MCDPLGIRWPHVTQFKKMFSILYMVTINKPIYGFESIYFYIPKLTWLKSSTNNNNIQYQASYILLFHFIGRLANTRNKSSYSLAHNNLMILFIASNKKVWFKLLNTKHQGNIVALSFHKPYYPGDVHYEY